MKVSSSKILYSFLCIFITLTSDINAFAKNENRGDLNAEKVKYTRSKLTPFAGQLVNLNQVKFILIEEKNDAPIIIHNFDLAEWTDDKNSNYEICELAVCVDLGRVFLTYTFTDEEQQVFEKHVELRFRLNSEDESEVDVFELPLKEFEYDQENIIRVVRKPEKKDTIGLKALKELRPNAQLETIEFQIAEQGLSHSLLSTKAKRSAYQRTLNTIRTDSKNMTELEEILGCPNYQDNYEDPEDIDQEPEQDVYEKEDETSSAKSQ